MAGRKKTPEPRCCSAAPSNEPEALYFAGKTPELCHSLNGPRTRARNCTTPIETLGIACSGQGITLLTRFCQDDRVRVCQPQRNLQVKFPRQVAGTNDFVAYIDAIGKLDGKRCLLEWKTSSSRYPKEPEGLLSLDPQLVCYSWSGAIRSQRRGGRRFRPPAGDI